MQPVDGLARLPEIGKAVNGCLAARVPTLGFPPIF